MKQREIKFRAWDKESKNMLVNNVEWNLGLLLSHPKDFIVMQYAGLKDKKGVEIYEGDIIMDVRKSGGKIWHDERGEVKFGHCMTNGEYTVYGFYMSNKDNEIITRGDNLEVIGNIYEKENNTI